MSSPLLPSPWKMLRADLIRELEVYEVAIHPKWTVPELRQTLVEQREIRYPKGSADPSTGLTKMKLPELIEKAEAMDLELPPKPTRGLLLKMLREAIQPPTDRVMTFGKYKSWLYKEVPESYMEWSIKEVRANTNASPDLRMFSNWAEQELAARKQRAKSSGYVTVSDDPEVRAMTMIDPPDVASVRSWTSSASKASSKYRTPTKEKRALPIDQEIEEIESMRPDMTPEDRETLTALETQLAVMKQKYQMPPRGSPQ